MRHLKNIVIVLFIAITINSCGTQSPKPNSNCPDEDMHGNIYTGFSIEELDTIFIRKYKKGDEFKTFIEEYIENPKHRVQKKYENYINIEYSKPLNTAFDYQIIVNGHSYYIKDFKVDWDIKSTMTDKKYACQIKSCIINDSLDEFGDCILDKSFGRHK